MAQWSSWNGNTHPLSVKCGRNTSATIALLMKYKYALPDNRKWREHVSMTVTGHEIQLRTHWRSKVTGISQPWLCCSWNINTYFLIIENGGNKSALMVPQMKWKYALPKGESGGNMSPVTVPLMEWKYTLPDNRKWQEQVSIGGVTNAIELRTSW